MNKIRIVCDGPPGPESGRFVEVEDESGKSIAVGTWETHQEFGGHQFWHLVLDDPREIAGLLARAEKAEAEAAAMRAVLAEIERAGKNAVR